MQIFPNQRDFLSKDPLPREAGDGVCLELKPKGSHERRKATLRYTAGRGWERKVDGVWVADRS